MAEQRKLKKHCITLPATTEAELEEIKQLLKKRGEDLAIINTSTIIRIAIKSFLEYLKEAK